MKSTKLFYPLCGMLAAALLAFSGCGEDSTGPSQNPEGWNEITSQGITLEWMVEDSTITVRVTAPTTGWVGVGFDPAQAMNEANFIIGYVSDASYLRDDYGTSQFGHESDITLGGTDDLSETSGTESSGETQIEFTMPLDSGDQYDKPLVEGNTYTVILAYGQSGADDFTSVHQLATSVSVEL